MRRIFYATIVFAFVAAASAFAFNPDELNKITFTNNTGTKIEMIFLSPGDSNFWGPDLVGADYVIKDGGTIGYYVHYPEATFKFDIMATDDQGNKFELRNFTLSDGKEAKVSLTKKNLNQAAPDFVLATVKLTNNTSHEIQYLFVSPSDSKAWGVDLLDEDTTLADGDTHSIVIPVGTDKVVYNLMAVDENNDEYQFDMNLDPNKGKDFSFSIEQSDLQTGN